MAGQKLTEKQQTAVIKETANFLITQPEGEAGSEVESVRRVQINALIAALRGFGLLSGYSTTEQIESALHAFVNSVDTAEGGIDVSYGDGSIIHIPIESGGLAFDGIRYDQDTGYFHITQNGEDVVDPCFIGGGGSGGSGSQLTFACYTPPSFSVIESTQEAIIRFKYTSVDSETDTPTGSGNLSISVGGIVRGNMVVQQGDNQEIDVFRYLSNGSNVVRLVITDSYGATATRTFQITKETFCVEWSLAGITVNTEQTLSFYVTPTGSGSKTIHTYVDGAEYATDVVTTSGRRITKQIHGLAHGAHTIEVYATMEAGGAELESEHLTGAVAQVAAGNTTPIVAVNWPVGTLSQYTTVNIPYIAIHPLMNPTTVTLTQGGEPFGSVEVDQTAQNWAYRPTAAGMITLGVTCGGITAEKTYTVGALEVDAEEIGDALTIKIDPSTMTDIRTWQQDGYQFTLSEHFDLINGGLTTDEQGIPCIRITAGDRLTLNYDPFTENPIATGREVKLIYKIANSSNKEAVGISAIAGGKGFEARANNAYLRGDQNTIVLSLCEGEKVELDINIQKSGAASDRLMSMWESCSTFAYKQYAQQEDFRHMPPAAMVTVFGCDDADVYLYLMRVYNRDLTTDEIKSNYIVDGADGQEIHARSTRNDIYDGSGNVSFQAAAEANPDAHFIIVNAPRMTLGKKDTVNGTIRHLCISGGAEHDWTAECDMVIQGTSSVEHAATAGGNIKFKFPGGITLSGSNEHRAGYAMNGAASMPTTILTYKKNIASEDHVVNRACAEFYNRYQPSIREARIADPRVRDCLDSTMCAVFFHNTGSEATMVGPDLVQPDETVFFGLGNLCTDKDAENVFAYDPIVIEVKNNTEPQVRFKSDDLSGDNWDNNYEFRYLDETLYTEEQARGLWQVVQSFVYECDYTAATEENLAAPATYAGTIYTTDSAEYRKAKWKAQAADHFDMDTLCYHHNYTLFHLLRDNRAKNMFWSLSPTTGKWGLWFNWDNDTGHCRNNEGYIDIEPGWMDFDVNGTADVFNGADNVVFVNLRECNFAELQRSYLDRENAGAWNADTFYGYIQESQNQLCEALWIEDAEHNGIRTLQNLGTAAYLERATGKLALHLKKSITFQKALVDSYYNATAATSDSASFRGYTPNEWTGVEPSGIVTVKPYTNLYINIHSGSTDYRVRANGGETAQLNIASALNDTEIYLRSAQWIQEIGDLSALYLGQFEASRLKRVKTLLVGSSVEGYRNTAFTTATFTNCAKLETLNLGGLVNAAQTFDLSRNLYLKEIYTKGSGVTGVRFAKNGRLETAQLNALTSLYMSGLWALTTFTLESLHNLGTLTVENCPEIDTLGIVKQTIDQSLTRLRLIGVDWVIENTDLLDRLLLIGGLNDSGADQEHPFLTGAVSVPIMKQGLLEAYSAAWPGLLFHYSTLIQQHRVTFLQEDGSIYYTALADRGSPIPDPASWWKHADATITVGTSAPSLPAPANGDYWYDTENETLKVFTVEGWQEEPEKSITLSASEPVAPAHGDWWYNTEKDELREWNQGIQPAPVKADSESHTFAFDGWNQSTDSIIADMTIEPVYAATLKRHRVRWWNGMLQKLAEVEVNHYEEAIYPGERPTDTSEEPYQIYKLFSGWDKSTGCVKEDLDVYAVYDIGALPAAGTLIQDMTPGEIYACIASGRKGDYFTQGDLLDLTLGFDPQYSNVERVDVIPHPMVLSGATCMNTGVSPFSTDDWTLAIDFEFTDSTAGKVLLSCMRDDGMMGFKLLYNGGPRVQWGTNGFISPNCNTRREMAVLRHEHGSKDITVYFSDHYKESPIWTKLTKTIDTQTDKTIYIGGHMGDDGTAVDQAAGILYSVQLWRGDLGEDVCKKICCWPRERYTHEVAGAETYYLADAPEQKSGLDLICHSLLERGCPMNTTATNAGGYAESYMNRVMMKRYDKALPEAVQSMLQRITVMSNHYVDGTQGNVQLCAVYSHIPAICEMGPRSDEPWAYEGRHIPYYTTDATRIKYMRVNPRSGAVTFIQDTDPALEEGNHVQFGDQWCNTADSNKYYLWDGVRWRVRAASYYWCRGATVTHASNFSYVHSGGSLGTGNNNATLSSGVCPRFSIGRRAEPAVNP